MAKTKNKALAGAAGTGTAGSDITAALEDILVRRGIIEKIPPKDENNEESKRRQQFLYHNTDVLLKNYCQIMWQLRLQCVEIAASLEAPLEDMDALLSRVDAEIGMGNRRLEASLEVQKRYRTMIARVNEALTLLKGKPGDGELLYELVDISYINPDPECRTAAEIAEKLHVSRRQYFRLREQAITVLATRLWGAPSQEIDLWLDVLTILDSKNR